MNAPLHKAREACGVIGIASEQLSIGPRLVFGLQALQHRGQESAGVATFGPNGLQHHRKMGWVSQIFTPDVIASIGGQLGVGHTRYATHGEPTESNAQPLVFHSTIGTFAIAHNGQLPMASTLRAELLSQGAVLQGDSDSELIGHFLALQPKERSWVDRLRALITHVAGAYSLTILTADAIFGLRDRYGFRPLSVGSFEGTSGRQGTAIASETSALDAIGAKLLFEVDPGEIVQLDAHAVRRVPTAPRCAPALCAFESVYFSRPDSILNGSVVQSTRRALGQALFSESPALADLVICVPDTGRPAALGYAAAAHLPFVEAIVKNRLLGRTFIRPSEQLRRGGVHLKYSVIGSELSGKSVVLIDDSVVRGHTLTGLIRLIRAAGAREVHVRIAAPAIRFPCKMGVDLPDVNKLIAHRHANKDLAIALHADSIHTLSLRALHAVLGAGQCDACFSGQVPHPSWRP